MSAATHLYRRKAVYYWRRRLPPALGNWFHKRHLFMSLQTTEPTFARRLVVLLDAKLEEVVTAHENADLHLSPSQLDGLLRDVVTKHLNKLERLSASAKAFPGFDASQAERDDRCAAWTYRLLHAQGASASVRPIDEAKMQADGLTSEDIAAVDRHLTMLRSNKLVPTRPSILEGLLYANGASANATNMALAQDVYFRGMWIALTQTERRYSGRIVEADDFVDQIFRDRAKSAPIVVHDLSGQVYPDHVTDPPPSNSQLSPQESDPDHIDDRFRTVADKLVKKRVKARRWTEKTKRQAEQIYSLLPKFLKEECRIENMSAVRQKDLAAFVHFLETEIYKNHGKSPKDEKRSIAEMRIIALSKKEEMRGLEAGTLNRHLTFIEQLFDFAEAEGVDLDPKVKINKLRAIDATDERERDERLAIPLAAIERLFKQPPFSNCLSWKEQSKPGIPGEALVFHGALYFIPMLIFYGGGRREEYCGLMIGDVITDNGSHPYLHIAKNKYRRIKNSQSKRNVVLHPELIRLGFLRYVEKIKALGYDLVFPDLYSPTTRSPLGDRYYKVFTPVLTAAGITEEGLGSHAIRHSFGAILKKRDVSEEMRADLLGHAGKSETSERYCEAAEIEQMYRLITKMPVVTRDLVALPINVADWVTEKRTAPFSHPSRARLPKKTNA